MPPCSCTGTKTEIRCAKIRSDQISADNAGQVGMGGERTVYTKYNTIITEQS